MITQTLVRRGLNDFICTPLLLFTCLFPGFPSALARSWSPPISITSGPGVCSNPAACTDTGGRVWIAWEEHLYDTNILARYYDGSGFSAPLFVASALGADMLPAITPGKDGSVWVAWMRNTDADPLTDQVFVSQFDGQSFGPAVCLSNDSAGVSWVSSCTDSLGRIWVVWGHELGDNDPLTDEVVARYYEGDWSEEILVSTQGNDNLECSVTPCGDGGVCVVWRTSVGPFEYNIVGRLFDGIRWRDTIRISTSRADEWSPASSVDATGNVWTSWVSNRGPAGYSDLYSGHFRRNRSPSLLAVTNDQEGDNDPSLCPDARAGIWLAWERDVDANNRPDDIYTAQFDAGAWGTPLRVTPETIGEAHNPCLTLGPEGRIWVVWNTDNGDWNIYASTFDPDVISGREDRRQ